MKNKSAKHAQKKTDFMMSLGLKIVLMALFVQGIFAEVKRGIVIKIGVEPLGNNELRLFIDLDTDGNRIADTYLVFPNPRHSALSRNIEAFLEKGMEVVFDDEGHRILRNGNIQLDGDNTISMDGVNMIDLFPNETERFKFAAEAKRRAQAPAFSWREFSLGGARC